MIYEWKEPKRVALPNSIRRELYFISHRWMGIEIGKEYRTMVKQDRAVDSGEITRKHLIGLLDHCRTSVPYYAHLMHPRGDSYRHDPESYLRSLPILKKETIRKEFERLKSADLETRQWRFNSSGGSTGEPVQLIQDKEFYARTGAVQWLSHQWAGRQFGEPGLRIWGSDVDVFNGTMGLKMNAINVLTNDIWFNAFQMTPEKMRACLEALNRNPPKLIIAYAHIIYDLAQFVEDEGIKMKPQKAILTSAGTLYPYMREKIESVFQCKVFNRYGSREVGDIACECEEHQGLHVFPWSAYVEVVDDQGQPLPPGVEGNIVVTCLSNYAMPLVRYFISDRGALSPDQHCGCGRKGQLLDYVSGRTIDSFKKADGSLVSGAFFTHLLFLRPWVKKFQWIQKDYDHLVARIVKRHEIVPEEDLEDILHKARLVMGPNCQVSFEFVEEIPPLSSGKFQYIFSEISFMPAKSESIQN